MSSNTIMPGTGFDLDNPNQAAQQDGPVECLGKTFANDAERREIYLKILAEKLKNPEFRKIEGFPIGEDEDILNLSDPPYYTACPNPFIGDFISCYGRPYDSKEKYKREPYASDVNEGKNDPIYNAHSYHTKVPHKAIMRYILHYTNPGDVVFDGFCGTGMTGVAAQMCGDKATVESLGYRVLPDGNILYEEQIDGRKSEWRPFSMLGVRKVVLNDISTAASFIAHKYNTPTNKELFQNNALKIVDEVLQSYEWMYETLHQPSDIELKESLVKLSESKIFNKSGFGKINFILWSDIFLCNSCSNEIVFWESAVDSVKGSVRDEFVCPKCKSRLSKKSIERSWVTEFDKDLGNTVKIAKQIPVLINYSFGKKRYEKKPDMYDEAILKKIETTSNKLWYPVSRLPFGKETRRNDSIGITHSHQFYTKRNLLVMSAFKEKCDHLLHLIPQLGMWFTSSHVWGTRMNRLLTSNYFKKTGGVIGQTLQGTLYVSSLSVETNLIERFRLRTRSVPYTAYSKDAVTQCGSCTEIPTPDNSLDYIFIDPPFGSNLMYSELNILWELWLKVVTNIREEAIENSAQKKGVNEYRKLMTSCFKEAYRVLKPGRWLTLEFSNTKASIWNNIQTALTDAGFIVSNVSALEKSHKGYRAVTTSTAVRQDLVISAYKPNGGFEQRFISESNEEGIWDFIRTHLEYLPVVKKQNGELDKIPERDPRILFDQVVAYFVRNLRDVPLSSKEFQDDLLERFAERDGMIFLPEQVAQYDKARMTSSQLRQLDIFVDDEASSIEWLRQLLNDKPQSYQDIHPKFINELSGWKKAEMQLELSTLLEQNFLKFDGQGQLPPQIHSYLSTNFKEFRNLSKDDSALLHKAKDRWYVPNPEREEDLQKLRERSLLKQFEEYKNHAGKKLKMVRMEAVRCGFKKAWQDRDYATIIQVAEKIPEKLLQEDQKLLMWYDQAQTRHSDSSLF